MLLCEHIPTHAYLQDKPSAEERTTQLETSPSAPQSPKIITDEEDPERDILQQEIPVQVCKLSAVVKIFNSCANKFSPQAVNLSMSDLFSFSIENSQTRRILAQDIQCRTIQTSEISY